MVDTTFAFLFEDAVLDVCRPIIQKMLTVIDLRSDMHILDLGCATGTVTYVIHEVCKERGIDPPPRISAGDISAMFVAAYEENKTKLGWHTTEAYQTDAADLSRWADGTFDAVVLGSVLEAIDQKDTVKAVSEMHRVLKPGGCLVANVFRENVITRILVQASAVVGRSEDEIKRLYFGKTFRDETTLGFLAEGGFDTSKIRRQESDVFYEEGDGEGLVNTFDTPFWKTLVTRPWTDEQKSRWRAEVENVLTEEEKKTGRAAMYGHIFAVEK